MGRQSGGAADRVGKVGVYLSWPEDDADDFEVHALLFPHAAQNVVTSTCA